MAARVNERVARHSMVRRFFCAIFIVVFSESSPAHASSFIVASFL